MSTFENALALEQAAEAELLLSDRRLNDRAKFLKQIRVRATNPVFAEELGTMIDLSRDGLYFTTRSKHYKIGMQVQITLPVTDSGWMCEVMRTELLPNGNLGIGVRIVR
jgi:hypothetical protein